MQRKEMIQMSHGKWEFSFVGVEFPVPDSGGIGTVLQPIDDAERNANGDAFIQPIAMKQTIPVSWSNLSGEGIHKIMSTLKNNRTGPLKYFDISENAVITKDVYWGAGVSVNYTRYDDELKKQLYSALSINFIEL